MPNLEQEVASLLCLKKLTLGIVESASGGLISHRITNIPGSSNYYKGSVIAYSNEIKIKLIGVLEETLNTYGAVSSQVVVEMAQGGRKILSADICLADTGIAEPSGVTFGKPPGLFYIGLSHQVGTYSQQHNFHGNRGENKHSATEAALGWLKEYLKSLK
jgi:nicotinamide-nucleotide amidase